jgi:hypothetical protein
MESKEAVFQKRPINVNRVELIDQDIEERKKKYDQLQAIELRNRPETIDALSNVFLDYFTAQERRQILIDLGCPEDFLKHINFQGSAMVFSALLIDTARKYDSTALIPVLKLATDNGLVSDELKEALNGFLVPEKQE